MILSGTKPTMSSFFFHIPHLPKPSDVDTHVFHTPFSSLDVNKREKEEEEEEEEEGEEEGELN